MRKKPAVLHFIDEERAKGTGDKTIQHKLLDAGWHMDIIHHAMHKRGEDVPAAPETSKGWWRSHTGYAFIGVAIFIVLALLALFA